jgi:adenylate cyclase class IV
MTTYNEHKFICSSLSVEEDIYFTIHNNDKAILRMRTIKQKNTCVHFKSFHLDSIQMAVLKYIDNAQMAYILAIQQAYIILP